MKRGMKRIDNERPISVYNADKQQLIGIFRMKYYVTKYLFSKWNTSDSNHVGEALRHKYKIHNSDLGVKVALRYANEQQLKTLGEMDFFMVDESLKVFDTSIIKKMKFERHDIKNNMR